MSAIVVAGYVGNKGELRQTPSGQTVINFSIAENKGKDNEPVWYKVTFWGKQAQILETYVDKGTFIVVSGEFEGNRQYQAGNGEWRDSLEITGSKFTFGPRTDSPGTHSSDIDIDFDNTTPVPF